MKRLLALYKFFIDIDIDGCAVHRIQSKHSCSCNYNCLYKTGCIHREIGSLSGSQFRTIQNAVQILQAQSVAGRLTVQTLMLL